jgi:hypothetical protein
MSKFRKKQKLVDHSNIEQDRAEAVQEAYKKGAKTGIANTEIIEPLPNIEFAPCETKYIGKNNSFLIFGRDRPSGRASGFGGAGATQCGRLDLCVGVGATYKRKDNSFGPPGRETLIDPNFVTTASRIYITQRGHIDKYMGLAEAKGFGDSSNRAAIGLKSDCVRIHGRQDIKIVTGRSKFEGLGNKGERLASGGEIDGVGTISFIAGNYTEDEAGSSFSIFNPSEIAGTKRKKLQPLVKGENLTEAMNELISILQEFNHRMNENSKRIDTLAKSYRDHFHDATPGFGGPSTPSVSGAMVGASFTNVFTKLDRAHIKINSKKLDTFKTNFLEPGLGSSYINSKYVFTT